MKRLKTKNDQNVYLWAFIFGTKFRPVGGGTRVELEKGNFVVFLARLLTPRKSIQIKVLVSFHF
jgi:hypothetical protein